MKYEFVSKVDQHLFDKTVGAWQSQLEANSENVSESHYSAALEFCARIVGGQSGGDGRVCAVKTDDVQYASALVVVTHAKNRNEVRMLNLYVQPDLNLADTTPNYAALAWIAASVMVGCLDLTYEALPARQLKLYTAFPLDREFMSALGAAIFINDELKKHYSVDSQGNWLVVAKLGEDTPRVRLADPPED